MKFYNYKDLENEYFTFVIQPRGYGKKMFEERKNKMNIKVTFTKEETIALKNALRELTNIDCQSQPCKSCPLYVNGSIIHSCLINILRYDVIDKYGYKEK